MPTPIPTHVEVQDMSDSQKEEIIGQVAISISLTSDDPPPLETIKEIAQELLAGNDTFKRWPLSNGQGGQTGYIESLHLAILESFKKPVQQEEGVAEAYAGSRTKLPGDLAPRGVLPAPAEEDE
jgi:hypothetical protein